MSTIPREARVTTAVRISPSLLKSVRELAEREERSTSAEIRRALRQHVQRDEQGVGDE